ncbi:NAD(P)H-hydrate dehydratase [Inquilinus limosus]|uniref:NAD(P)H-hydrate dehydratase n=1 Tax=Inquilinus limosus TaxID=171674 RepID=UPI003F13E05B
MTASDLALLTAAEMGEADRRTIAAGTPGIVLMERAGAAVARAIRARWSPRPVAVLCGPGNNGGDGHVVARLLAERGWPVRLASLVPVKSLRGDAAEAAAQWRGRVEAPDPAVLDGAGLIVDALFGAGLSRVPEGKAAALIEAAARSGLPVVAVDVPSGLFGDDGSAPGPVVPAALTVTFFRRKPGHLLLPGRALCGETRVADIGIDVSVLGEIGPRLSENGPALWRPAFPRVGPTQHKYDRGHPLILGGGSLTGASRLAARAARRIGAGLLTVVAPEAALPAYRADWPGAMALPAERWDGLLADRRLGPVLIGPGAGAGPALRETVAAVHAAGKSLVLDADGIASFAGEPQALAGLLDTDSVLTPHQGEFDRLFGKEEAPRLARARKAAAELGAVVVLKGSDTIIAAPDGRAAINANAPPTLATGGTGDVLAGLVLGLKAQGMPGFEAACAAVWLHGAAAQRVGAGLIAEDVIDALPGVLDRL